MQSMKRSYKSTRMTFIFAILGPNHRVKLGDGAAQLHKFRPRSHSSCRADLPDPFPGLSPPPNFKFLARAQKGSGNETTPALVWRSLPISRTRNSQVPLASTILVSFPDPSHLGKGLVTLSWSNKMAAYWNVTRQSDCRIIPPYFHSSLYTMYIRKRIQVF